MNLLNRIEFPNLFSGEITVEPIAVRIFGINVYWYGIIITAAVALGVLYAMRNAPKTGVLPDNVFDLAFWGVLGGVIGARSYYVFFWNINPENLYKYNLVQAITGIRDGGLAIYGGVIGGVLGAVIASRVLKIKLLPVLDVAALGFLIGHCIGRWGNFTNQEAFGAPTASELPWGMTSEKVVSELSNAGMDTNALVHPCFLYESLWCLLGFLVLHFYIRKARSYDGEVFLLYVVWYGTGRAFIEQLRMDSLMAGGLKASQVLAIASAAFALILFIYFKLTLRKDKGYTVYKDTDECAVAVERGLYRIKLEKEKANAKKALARTRRTLESPESPSIIETAHDGEDDENGENP